MTTIDQVILTKQKWQLVKTQIQWINLKESNMGVRFQAPNAGDPEIDPWAGN